MIRPGLKLRYVLTVLAVGALLTAGVAYTTWVAERAERESLTRIEAQLDEIATTDPRVAETAAQLHRAVKLGYDHRVTDIVIAGALLTFAACLVIFLLMTRIDRALTSLMDNARSIGSGRVAEPVAVSGVAEVGVIVTAVGLALIV